jgi:hypothetical protein
MAKSQEELEKPVKGYELEAVTTQLISLTGIVEKLESSTSTGFDKINTKLDKGFTGLATTKYVDDEICRAKTDIFETFELKYGKQSKGIDKFKWIIISGLIGIGMQVIAFFTIGGIK